MKQAALFPVFFCFLTATIWGDAASSVPPKLPDGVKRVAGKIISEKDGAELVYVSAGEFLMGDVDQSMNPRATVYVDAFLINKYEVTNEQYRKFVQATGHREPGYEVRKRGKDRVIPVWKGTKFSQPNQPVVGVSWDDAVAYCQWAGKLLPTQAQFEKAARGTKGQKYSWGNEAPDAGGVFHTNYAQSFRPGQHGKMDDAPLSAAVGKFSRDKSPFGAMDMAGNVAEWCRDWWAKPDRRTYRKNPAGPDSGQARIIKGGSWTDNILFADPFRTSHVLYQVPARRSSNLGFRGVIPIPDE